MIINSLFKSPPSSLYPILADSAIELRIPTTFASKGWFEVIERYLFISVISSLPRPTLKELLYDEKNGRLTLALNSFIIFV